MPTGLDLSRVVNVSINLSPTLATYRNFGDLVIIGSTNVIDTSERIRLYNDLPSIATAYGTTAPEYLAASLFFAQSPQPAEIYMARWAQTATNAILHGSIQTPLQQQIANFQAITTGAFKINVDGTPYSLSALNFSGASNLNGVASIIQTALRTAGAANATVVWGSINSRFDVLSGTTGTASTVSYATAPTSGTDISVLLGLSATPNALGAAARPPVPGLAAESLTNAVSAIANASGAWYAAVVATATPPADADHLAVAAFIEGSTPTRMYGITTQNTTVLDPTQSTDICSVLFALGYKRTFTQYSSYNPYAVVSMFGRAATVNFNGYNTALTLKFKQEPGVIAETLTASQATALEAKNCNVFVNYDNATAILEQGVMANGFFFDEVQGADALQNQLQIDLYNLLEGSFTKIPQTDAGQNLLITQCYATATRFISNGWIAPAIWYTQGFGTLVTGQKLNTGVYFYSDSFDLQSQTDRVARKSMPIQGAITLSGAIHTINCAIQINR
jgi:hypothetical protein